MGIGIITNFNINTSANIDARLGPYDTTAQAKSAVPEIFRYVGMTLTIIEGGAPVEYWFNPTTVDEDLVVKSQGGGSEYSFNTSALVSGGGSNTYGLMFSVSPANCSGIFVQYYLVLDDKERVPSRTGTVQINVPAVNYTTQQLDFREQTTPDNSTLNYKTTPGNNTQNLYIYPSYNSATGKIDCELINKNGYFDAYITGTYKLTPKILL